MSFPLLVEIVLFFFLIWITVNKLTATPSSHIRKDSYIRATNATASGYSTSQHIICRYRRGKDKHRERLNAFGAHSFIAVKRKEYYGKADTGRISSQRSLYERALPSSFKPHKPGRQISRPHNNKSSPQHNP